MRLEQGADLGVVAFFDGGAITVAGVVDQDVDAAEALLGLLYGRADLLGVGDVEGGGEYALGRRLGQVGDFGRIARGDDGVVAGADHSFGEGATESGRAAGDEPGGHGEAPF